MNNERLLLFFIFAGGLIELNEFFKNKENDESRIQNRCTLIISSCFFLEGIFFIIPIDNSLIGILCTVVGVTMFACIAVRYKIRKRLK